MNYNEDVASKEVICAAAAVLSKFVHAAGAATELRGARHMLIFSTVTAGNSGTNRTEQPDEQLITRIGTGDREAFLLLYEQISNAVFAYALSLVRNRDDAEDIMQDTFLKIRAAAHLYEAQGKPMAWILTITRNLCMMHFRQKKHVDYEPLTEKTQGFKMPADPGTDRIQETEDRIVLEAAFRVLSDEERQIIILHAVSGMKHREISELLNKPLSTVLSKYRRGLKKLRMELEETI